jgi:hypothetical protein
MRDDDWQKELDRLLDLSKFARANIARLEQEEPSLDLIKAYDQVIEVSVQIQAHLKSKFA